MNGRKKNTILITILIIVSIIIACNPSKLHKTLTFFFDGVPDPNFQTGIQDTVAIDSVVVASTTQEIVLPKLTVHLPYQEKKCNNCHEKSSMGKLKIQQPDLCYQCHNDYKDEYVKVHGPAAGGYCTTCHNPHQSKEKKLVHHIGQKLCFTCHDSINVKRNRYHLDKEIHDCISCHNPHGGDSRFMVEGFACAKCHDNYPEKYKFTHGPVNGGHCLACHDSHNSNKKKLISREGNMLCLDCHNKALIYNEMHHKDKGRLCLNCHNPHGGENRYYTDLN